jgi:hypothetical protein
MAMVMAHVYHIVGESELAMDELEKLLALPFKVSRAWLLADPFWESLHENPRFQKILETKPGVPL